MAEHLEPVVATANTTFPPCRSALFGCSIKTIQVNLGLRCNLACHHCHVLSSPKRSEQMTWETMLLVLKTAQETKAVALDITGGAPEMHPDLMPFIDRGLELKLQVSVRTNLTVMELPDYRDLPVYFANRGVRLVASLPCYLPENVDRQRGQRVFEESIRVMQALNRLGYGQDEDKALDLVYNPVGLRLPPDSAQLEQAYRKHLSERFAIRFNRLITLTNMPIGRFLHDLEREGHAESYFEMLQAAYNPLTLDRLMCRDQLHIGHDGRLYDCDFNYALGLTAQVGSHHLRELNAAEFIARRIKTDRHCYGCTANQGSSCNGTLL